MDDFHNNNDSATPEARRTEGIESNESSRFVDYTVVSPFEDLVSIVEKSVSAWMDGGSMARSRVVFEYMESHLVLNFFSISGVPDSRYIGTSSPKKTESNTSNNLHFHAEALLRDWFGLDPGSNCVVLSKVSEWTNFTTSERRFLLGALVAGLKASEKLAMTVFSVSSTLGMMHSANEVFGYSIDSDSLDVLLPASPPSAEIRAVWSDSVEASTGPVEGIVRYESYLSGAISSEHPFFFFDGIKALYLTSRRRGSECNPVRMRAEMSYQYHSGSVRIKDRPKTKRKDALNLMRRILNSQCEAAKDSLLLNRTLELLAHLHYTELDFLTVIDNQTYSNLVPSQQRFNAWKIHATFQYPAAALGVSGTEVLSACVRRLLSLYIVAKCVPHGWTMGALKETGSLSGEVLERAQSITAILSKSTQEKLHELSHPMETEEQKLVVQQVKYMEVLFPQEAKMLYFDIKAERVESQNPVNPNSAAFGSWLSLCSVLSGCLLGGVSNISEFWEICIDGLRKCLDKQAKDLTHSLSISCIQSHHCTSSTSSDKKRSNGTSTSLQKDSLWSEVLNRVNIQNGLCVSVPDVKKTLLVQKLQMLQFCAAVKHESNRCMPHPSSCPDMADIVVPELCRRLPDTSDRILQREFVLQKVAYDTGEDAIVGLQIQHPVLISDLRAFKAANPQATLTQFEQWYQVGTDTAIDSQIKECLPTLWKHCDACPASDQTPFFNAEKEAEQCMSFFEALSPVQFAAEMLSLCLETVLVVLKSDVELAEGGIEGADSWSNRNPYMVALEADILQAVNALRVDTPAFGIDDNVKESVSQPLLRSLDAICNRIMDLETYAENAGQLTAFIKAATPSSPITVAHEEIIRRLARSGEIEAANEEEGTIMFHLVKYMESSKRVHDWHSADARELGTPFQKKFFCESTKGHERMVMELDTVKGRMRVSSKFVC